MTEKQKYALEKIIISLPEDCQKSYREIAEYAISLGYMPVLRGVREDYADFTNNKTKRTILKINTNPDFRWIAMKFYAISTYTGIFKDAVEMRLAYWKKLGYKAHCFKCGKCDGTQGYKINLHEGNEGFLCGFGVLPIPTFTSANILEVKEALRVQNEFFRANALIKK